jgi:uncharacterized protein
MAELVIRSKNRFYVETQSGEAELLYKVKNGIMYIYHTFVPEPERRKGVAEMMAKEAFEYARNEDLKIKPDCSYILHFIEMHKELQKYVV